MIIFLQYFELKKFLISLGYSEFEAREVIKKRIRKLSKPVDRAFYHWYKHSKMPEGTLEVDGITFETLTKDLSMMTMQALLYLDWLAKEPEVARKALRKMKDYVQTASRPDTEEPRFTEPEDTSDIQLEDK